MAQSLARGMALSFPRIATQISNLPYRRLAACRAPGDSGSLEVPVASRLQIGDTADCKSALPHLDDFIDRMTGKAAAALVGVVWNLVFFKFFVYA